MRGNKPSMLENQKFGRLTALRRSAKADKSGSVFWICRCDCGNEVTVRSDLLKRLHTQSCGCLKKEALRCIENEVFEYNGDKLTLENWCDLMDLDKDTTYLRAVRGISLQRIVEE